MAISKHREHTDVVRDLIEDYKPDAYHTFKESNSADFMFRMNETLYVGSIIEENLTHGTITHAVDENDLPDLSWASEDTTYLIVIYCTELDSYYLVTEEDIGEDTIFIRVEHLESRTVSYMDWEQDRRLAQHIQNVLEYP